MDNVLLSLQVLEGVNGVFVADGTGKLLGYRAHSVYDVDLLQGVSKTVAGAIDSVKLIQSDWSAVNAHYSEGMLLVRNLGGRETPDARLAMLVVVADNRLNISFAGVAVRVAVAKLKVLIDSNPAQVFSASTWGPAPVAPGGGVASQLHATVPVAASGLPGVSTMATSGRAVGSDVASSGLSWSGLSGSSMSGSGISVVDSASADFLTMCTRALARVIGPMAKLYIKDAVRKVSPGSPFSRDCGEALIEELCRNITKPELVAKFRAQLCKTI
jgi:hypothetical protein